MRVLLYGESDVLTPFSASHRYVSLVLKGLREHGVVTELSGTTPSARGSHVLKAIKGLTRLRKVQNSDVTIYYGQISTSLIGLWMATRIYRRSLSVYLVEWPTAVPDRPLLSRLNARLFCATVFRLADSVIVISEYLDNLARRSNPEIAVLRVPIMIDRSSWTNIQPLKKRAPLAAYCADLNGYIHDACFVISALASTTQKYDLVMIGDASTTTRTTLQHFAQKQHVADRLQIRSGVPDYELRAVLLSSDVLFLPMSNDERSRARFPSKLADYLVTGAQIITSRIGEVGTLLDGNEFVRFITPGDAHEAGRVLDSIPMRSSEACRYVEGPASLDYFSVTFSIVAFLDNLKSDGSGIDHETAK